MEGEGGILLRVRNYSTRAPWSYAATVICFAVAYFIGAKLGLRFAFVNQSATAVWPPTGISIAILLLFGYRLWPGIFIGSFVANLTTAGTVLTSLGIATGNTIEGLIAVYLVNVLVHGKDAFEHPLDIFKFGI